MVNEIIGGSEPVDRLEGLSHSMWECLIDWLSTELEISIPNLGYSPHYLLDLGTGPLLQANRWSRNDASAIRTRIAKRRAANDQRAMYVFQAYGLHITNGDRLEQQGLDFLQRQRDHFSSPDEVLLLTMPAETG